jgi:hypothetical protein
MPHPRAEEIIEFIEDLARKNKMITYGKLASTFALPPMTEHFSNHVLSRIFDIMDKEDGKAKRPFRTSLVYNSETSIPGPGFFKALTKYRGDPPISKDRWLDVASEEVRGVHERFGRR